MCFYLLIMIKKTSQTAILNLSCVRSHSSVITPVSQFNKAYYLQEVLKELRLHEDSLFLQACLLAKRWLSNLPSRLQVALLPVSTDKIISSFSILSRKKTLQYSCVLNSSHTSTHAELLSETCLHYKTCHTILSKTRMGNRSHQLLIDVTMTSLLLCEVTREGMEHYS